MKSSSLNSLTLIIGLTALTNTYADDRALLVGIDEYRYISPLIGSKQDVEIMREFIQTEWHYQPQQIRVLTDADATRTGILAAFDNWLIRGSQPGDKVLFFYTGHGAFIEDKNGDEADRRDETLCPVDTTIKRENMILDDEIDQRLQRLRGRKVTLIIDACHSGTITKSAFGGKKRVDRTVKVPVFASGPYTYYTRSINHKNAFPTTPTPTTSTTHQLINPHPHVITYTAVAANQEALVDTNAYPYMGVFTRRFLAGVQDKRADRNRDGQITHQELLQYLRQKSTIYCRSHPQQCGKNGLTPQLASAAYLKNTDINQWLKRPTPDPMPGIDRSPISSSTQAPRFTPSMSTSLRLQVQPRPKLAPGQRMQIKITSENTGYLLLFDVSTTDNEIQQIFPNFHSRNQKPRAIAGKPRIVPDKYAGFELTATSVTGKRYLLALLIPKAKLLTPLKRRLPQIFRRLNTQNAQTFIQQLNQQLQPEFSTVHLGIIDYEVTEP